MTKPEKKARETELQNSRNEKLKTDVSYRDRLSKLISASHAMSGVAGWFDASKVKQRVDSVAKD